MGPEPSPELINVNQRSSGAALDLLNTICAEQLRLRGKRLPRRCVGKAGDCRLEVLSCERDNGRFYRDLFTSLIEIHWRWTLVFVFALYMSSWIIFAIAWYVTLHLHGDIDNFGQPDWKPCVTNIENFATAFLFSLETQHTTGFGYYHITDSCPQAMSLLCIQSIFGVIIETFLVGLMFVKMTSAKRRSSTLAFSRNAVICQRDGKLTLLFRVGDLRTKTHLLQTQIRAQVVRRRITMEGEVIDFHQDDLKVNSCKERDGSILLLWPTIVSHTIDSSSPLYCLKPEDLSLTNEQFEIVVVLEGTVESTGLVVQARTSYMPVEILWGHRFEELVRSMPGLAGERRRVIDYARFDETVPVKTTTLSASQLDAFQRNRKTSSNSSRFETTVTC